MTIRLPQDIDRSDTSGVPDLASFTKGAAAYARQHARAVEGHDFRSRAEACWGLIASGSGALPWARDCLDSGDTDLISDAGGVLRAIGVPPEWLPSIRSIVLALPDGEAADSLIELLEAVEGLLSENDESDADEHLFGGARLPFTEPIWFLRASLEQTAVELEKWMDKPGEATFLTLHEPLSDMVDRLEPFAVPSWKQLIVGTTGDWTAVFSQGSDIYTAQVIADRLGVASVRTHYSPHIVRGGERISYGDRAFWYSDGGGRRRTIQASFQSRWDWDLSGVPLRFEDRDAYDAKRIPDRLTLARLNDYCRALGIDRNDAAFYRPDGILVERDTSSWSRRRINTMSSARWRVTHR